MSLMTKRMASQISDAEYDARFKEIIEAEWPTLQGRQVPEILVFREGGDSTHGEKAIELARRFGVKLMPWQRDQVLLMLALDEHGKWLHPDVALICPRQNGKSLILEVIILYRLFVLHHQIVFSAHQWRTAKSIRNRIWRRIRSKKWAHSKLVRNTASAGEAEMETADGGKVQFTTRSNDMGRGFDQIDVLIIDEAYNLDSGELDAVAPTQLAADDPQTYYASSAVNKLKHPKGEELSRIRERALRSENETMLFAEFRAPEGLDPEDPATWILANPSYGVIATEKKILSMLTKLSPTGFQVEILGWGLWFEFSEGTIKNIFPLATWQTVTVAEPVRVGERVLVAEVSMDGKKIWMVSGGKSSQGTHLEVSPHSGEFHVEAALAAIQKFVDANDPAAVIYDPTTPTSVLEPGLRKLGIAPIEITGGQNSEAFRHFEVGLSEGKVTNDGHPAWEEALEVAVKKVGGGGKYVTVDRFSGEVAVLSAGGIAVWGLEKFSPTLPQTTLQIEQEITIENAVTLTVPSNRLAATGGRRMGDWG